jgi:molybdopterin-guanine dinucleotide biosynthesis protein A
MKSVIILCGGRSKRMGKDKGSIIFKGKPMICHVLDVVKDVADEVILVLREDEQVESYSGILKDYKFLKIVTDRIKDQGPLVGILTGLSCVKSVQAQILPCDSPFISKEFLLKMFRYAESSDFDAIVPIWDDGHIEPLHSIYKKNTANYIEDLLKNEKRDVNSFISKLNVKFIDVKELYKERKSFQNINTIKDIDSL